MVCGQAIAPGEDESVEQELPRIYGAHEPVTGPVFSDAAQWIWSSQSSPNQYILFVKDIVLPAEVPELDVRIAASYHYELYVNGTFINRGPVHGDPRWCQVDALRVAPAVGPADTSGDVAATAGQAARQVQIAVVVHHAGDIHLHYLLPAPGGLIVEIRGGDLVIGTDESWRCLQLPMWREDVPPRGWALDYCEDYDARREPKGWAGKRFDAETTATWPRAVPVVGADQIWSDYQLRLTPYLERCWVRPRRLLAYRASTGGPTDVGDISQHADEEPLTAATGWLPYDVGTLSGILQKGNAITFDLGAECVGFYEIAVDAPAGVVIEISGAELLRDNGRPWIYRKGTRYSARYVTRQGVQRFTTFGWSGFRYLHVVVRGDVGDVTLLDAGCRQRRAPLPSYPSPDTGDPMLDQVFEVCTRTLAICAQEHLIDCPTREQTQYWGDALHVAESLWVGFGERSYMDWYLDGFLHVPIRENGQISSTYPGDHTTLLDYTLIPVLGQAVYRRLTGHFYKPGPTLAKALRLKRWYDARLNDAGLIAFDYEAYAAQDLRNFIDHPGIGWHNFPHPGIDRHGVSCPLNAFFYGFVRALAELAREVAHPEAAALTAQAAALRATLRKTFYDGTVFHDAIADAMLSPGTSWQTNALAVYFDIVTGPEATRAMQAMIDGYDTLCRCSPYFHFYFLPALRKAGLEDEARELIKREWGPMLDAGATTTWEGFLGDEKDSLCHPWSTAPLLFLLRESEQAREREISRSRS